MNRRFLLQELFDKIYMGQTIGIVFKQYVEAASLSSILLILFNYLQKERKGKRIRKRGKKIVL